MRSSEVADRGSVTAEAAVALPALVVFAMALVWALMAASAQIQCVDAARAGARAAARSEPRAATLAAARSAAPSGASVTLGRTGDLWRVRVEAKAPGPGALALTLSAEAAAFAEDAAGQEVAS
ncbi:pilus assembly protein [Streptomyces sp. NBC_00879]|uniref:TadE family type IV pilus minor pilin n=1 Tax=Streptomyces sp. NBC_00879 TaxID=2975855 RepID=UPI0038638E05|nr:pilus assembly protein [Streptomyces sp. NBC_00879]